MINDRILVDHDDLMRDFGLTEEQSLHQTGDFFATQDEAAIAFTLMYQDYATVANSGYIYNGKEQPGIEVGAYIY
jgi:hypothetical protein